MGVYLRTVHAHDVPESAKHSDCYQASAEYVIGHPEYTLVHGVAVGHGPIEGIVFGHAWVELGDTVLNVANGKMGEYPKAIYYAVGQVSETVRYSSRELFANLAKFMNWGPWDPKVDV